MSAENNNQQNSEQLELQGKQMAGLLDNNAQRLSMSTLKKLEDGRSRAVNAHQKQQGATVNLDGTLSSWTSWVEHHRFAFAGMILATLIVSFLIMQGLQANETGDAFLLAADLPPEAFVDRGFEPSLNNRVNI